jgi:hypothetical protein
MENLGKVRNFGVKYFFGMKGLKMQYKGECAEIYVSAFLILANQMTFLDTKALKMLERSS